MKDALSLIRDLNGKFEAENMKWKHLICDQINTSGASAAPPLSGKIAVIMKDYLSGFYDMGQELETTIAELCRSNSMLSNENTELAKRCTDSIPIDDIGYAGEYNPASHYIPGDIVKYADSLYLCIKRCTEVAPSRKDMHWRIIELNTDYNCSFYNAGEYDSEKTYTTNDVVIYSQEIYACWDACKGITPSADSKYWKRIVRKSPNMTASSDLKEKYNQLYLDHTSLYTDYLSVSKEYELFKENISISDFDLVKPYFPGNIVYYKAELYLNVKQCVGVSPRIKNMSWKKISMSGILNSINKNIIDKLHYGGLYEPTMTYSEGTIVKYNNHLWVSLMDDNEVEPTKRDKNGCCTWWGISNSDKLVVRSNDYERTIKDKINAIQQIKRLKDDYNDLVIKYNTIQNKLRIMSSNITALVNNLRNITSPETSPENKIVNALACKGQANIIYNECQEILEPIQSDFTADLVNSINQIVNIAHINIDDIHQTDEDALETLDDIEAREGDIIKLARKVIEKIIGESIDA